ncbi:MAG TPA: hypothetical protein VD761_06305 [Solirubrobacterales bacterium]|nr:hypothetical protein [Solirubrobacterales bacterium]
MRISVTAPAELRRGAVEFPVSGGKLDPATERGTVEHEGAVVFTAGARRIPIKALQLKTTQRRAPLSAKVGGSQLKLGTVRSIAFSRAGFGARITVSRLAVSAKLATRLGKKLDLKGLFEPDQALGSVQTQARPETITVLGEGKAALTLDPGFEAKLRSLFVAVNPIFPAERSGAAFTLPLSGGTISPDGLLGTVASSGTLEFIQLGGGQVFWQNAALGLSSHSASAALDVQPSPPYVGKIESALFASMTLTSPAVPNPQARTVTIPGASLGLDPVIAATFNEVFAKPKGRDGVFAAGEALGTVSFAAQGQ